MTPDFRELLGENAGARVRRSARRNRNDDAHDTIGPIRRILGSGSIAADA
jgi:hypothetical protein